MPIDLIATVASEAELRDLPNAKGFAFDTSDDTLKLKADGVVTPVATLGGASVLVFSTVFDPASVAANTTAEQTRAVPGLVVGDRVFVNKPTATAGLGIVNARVSATDTLAVTFVNATAGAIDPPSETYLIVAIRS